MVDIRQTKEYARYLSQIGWTTERIKNTNYFIKKLPLIGSVIKIQRPQIINFPQTEKLRKKYRAFQIIIEPSLTSSFRAIHNNSLYAHSFKLSKLTYLPSKTIHLDLSQTKEEIFNNFKKDCKSAIRKNSQITIKNYQIKEVKEFRHYWQKAVGFKRYIPPINHLTTLKKTFGHNCLLSLYTDNNKKIISGAIFLIANKTAYYWQAFTNKEGRKVQSQYQIVWQGILWAKKKKVTTFDFEGIYDNRFPNKSWLGFTHFKKAFGGREIEYPGCYTKTYFLK